MSDRVARQSASEDHRIEQLPTYLNLADLAERVLHLKRTATYSVIARADFPAPIDLGGRRRLWRTLEVLSWVDRQPRLYARSVPESLASRRRYRNGQLVSNERAPPA